MKTNEIQNIYSCLAELLIVYTTAIATANAFCSYCPKFGRCLETNSDIELVAQWGNNGLHVYQGFPNGRVVFQTVFKQNHMACIHIFI